MSNAKYFVKVGNTFANEIVKTLRRSDVGNSQGLANNLEEMLLKAETTHDSSIYVMNTHLTQTDIVNGEIVGLLSSLDFYAKIYEPKTAEVMLAAKELILRLMKSREKRTILMHKYKSKYRETQSDNRGGAEE